ncbi:gamma-glutamyltransferase [Paenibacillus apiarius]|uniref:Glutathione hydrolase proenzyme n=1 Tax=Paenibacillus apiarius TaxID=46240 RepID=A0ABT4DNP1_9BACL|nr:gamma-glutamyltransferase [Paenibacillus apiarius]MCY9512996.1 gamma-glutamyltransferase [Paenibacillus apiarius]MCY9518980.1 gamma-glutamyltransferase [Paenibacillus apiarius]MCY9550789.1 gamma-glutamyltransferase [Paenibacillus apiarius]MCY9559777.1 gamma-glutamyltransferase [Paenibacillus apiarius]MCY9682020.1 gamma-glutamyltransferase [Paenibacillus apiarius]
MRFTFKKWSMLLLSCLLFVTSFSAAGAANRPTTMAQNGMVTTPHYLASAAALQALEDGGNAVDAAIAAASTLAVVYPHYTSIGGDSFWLIYNAKTKEVKALNASGRSGENVTIDFYKNKGYDKIPSRGYLAANTVPGAVSGWGEAYEYAKKSMDRHLPWDKVLERAIGYAEHGYPVTPNQEYWTKLNLDTSDKELKNLQRFESFRNIFLKPNGEAYKPGEVMVQKDLANTLQTIADKGAGAFYKGEIADKIVKDIQVNGGVLTKKDFAGHKADWVKPISVDYRGYTAYNVPPNSQGMASLSILNILNHFDLKSMGEGTADYYHVIVEATKQAFADRDKWLTDPDFVDIPLDQLLSKQHGKDMAARIDMKKAAESVKPLDPKGDTVWLGFVDKDGNAVSLIQSHYFDYGAGVVAKDTGVILQNRGSFFSLDPTHINKLEPKKRTFHTLNPAMLLKGNKPYMLYGTQGGEGQPQTQTALVTRVVDFGFTVQDAIEAPRWLHGRNWGSSSNDLKMEGRVPQAVRDELVKRGHPVQPVADYTDTVGQSGIIMINPDTNVKFGGADPRGEGAALGY